MLSPPRRVENLAREWRVPAGLAVPSRLVEQAVPALLGILLVAKASRSGGPAAVGQVATATSVALIVFTLLNVAVAEPSLYRYDSTPKPKVRPEGTILLGLIAIEATALLSVYRWIELGPLLFLSGLFLGTCMALMSLARYQAIADGMGAFATFSALALGLAGALMIYLAPSVVLLIWALGLCYMTVSLVSLTALRFSIVYLPSEVLSWVKQEASFITPRVVDGAFGSILPLSLPLILVVRAGDEELGFFRSAQTMFGPYAVMSSALLVFGLSTSTGLGVGLRGPGRTMLLGIAAWCVYLGGVAVLFSPIQRLLFGQPETVSTWLYLLMGLVALCTLLAGLQVNQFKAHPQFRVVPAARLVAGLMAVLCALVTPLGGTAEGMCAILIAAELTVFSMLLIWGIRNGRCKTRSAQ